MELKLKWYHLVLTFVSGMNLGLLFLFANTNANEYAFSSAMIGMISSMIPVLTHIISKFKQVSSE